LEEPVTTTPTTDQQLDLDAIEARANAATEGPWDAHCHSHPASGCRCLSCDDPAVGWTVDHPKARDCDEIVAERSADGTLNDFRRPLASCDHGPLLSYEDASFAAHARNDVPAMAAEIRRLRARVAELERPAVEKQRNEIRASFTELSAQAAHDRDHEGAFSLDCRLREREEHWAREDAAAPSAAHRS
jgi:hypothetical protein